MDVLAVPAAREPACVLRQPSVSGAGAAEEQLPAGAVTSNPKTRQFKQVNICFDTHHVQFAADKDQTLYGNGVFSGAIGWINTRILDETGDEAAAQGWCRGYHDLDEDGKVNPSVDRQIAVNVLYSVIPHPSDGSVWAAAPGPMPGKILRIDPKTCVGEAYEPPFDPAAGVVGYTPRGIDVDSNGVIWTALASSGHLASFDRRKCKGPLQGPSATNGQHCREGWTLHSVPGPRFKNVRGDVAVDFRVSNFVDRFNTFGLGENVPFANGTNSDSLLALQPDGTWLVLRVPYPLGFFSRGMDGRIDNPKTGWKGNAICASYSECHLAHRGRPRHPQRGHQVPASARSAGEVAGAACDVFLRSASLSLFRQR